jgi:hypothetical protein
MLSAFFNTVYQSECVLNQLVKNVVFVFLATNSQIIFMILYTSVKISVHLTLSNLASFHPIELAGHSGTKF